MKKEHSARWEKTEKKIIDSAMRFISDQKKTDITVTDICKDANINKTTFYEHYQNIDSLYFALEKDYLKEIELLYPLGEKTPFTSDFFIPLLTYVKENHVIVRRVINHYYNYESDELNEICKKFYYAGFEKCNISNKTKMKYSFIFYSSGRVACIRHWIENGFTETPEEMSEILFNCLPDALK